MAELKIKLNKYQDIFIFAEERYSALIAGVGTGKTFSFLLKAWQHCQQHPNSLGLIVRKEYADLRDSTVQDFQKYFGVKINQANKEYDFVNGSKIMFRHGDLTDINVLKNINLSFFGIEQAEEYKTDDIFDFLRDRLRRQGSKRWGMVIANADGHNWVYKRFVNGADITEVNAETGEFVYRKGEYICATANSFANAHNLPDDFVADLRAMETEAPNHYYQFVANSFETTQDDDFLFSAQDFHNRIGGRPTGARVMGFDVARMGKDKSVVKILEHYGGEYWKEIHSISWGHKPITYSTGRVLEIASEFRVGRIVVDEDGLGSGAVDILRESRFEIQGYRGGLGQDADYFNNRSRDYFSLKDAIHKGYLELSFEETKESLQTIKYFFQSNKQKRILGKNEMKLLGYHSPDDADAMMMAFAGTELFDCNNNSDYGRVITLVQDFDPFD